MAATIQPISRRPERACFSRPAFAKELRPSRGKGDACRFWLPLEFPRTETGARVRLSRFPKIPASRNAQPWPLVPHPRREAQGCERDSHP